MPALLFSPAACRLSGMMRLAGTPLHLARLHLADWLLANLLMDQAGRRFKPTSGRTAWYRQSLANRVTIASLVVPHKPPGSFLSITFFHSACHRHSTLIYNRLPRLPETEPYLTQQRQRQHSTLTATTPMRMK